MTDDTERKETIRRFLTGEMQPHELDRLRRLLDDDPTMRRMLDLESGVEALACESAERTLSDIDYTRLVDEAVASTDTTTGTVGTQRWLRVYALAATLVLAVLGGYVAKNNVSRSDTPSPVAVDAEGPLTVPEHGKSITRLSPAGVLVAEEGTRARVSTDEDSTVNVIIAQGNTWFDVAAHQGSRIHVVTPHSAMSVEGTVFRVVVTELETEIMVLEGAVEVVHRSSPGSFRRLAAGRTGFADHRSLQSSAALTPELCERRTTLLRTYVEWVEHQMRG